MNGQLFPSGLLELFPWWLYRFENIATIQFNHRLLATLLLAALVLQITLGISTLLLIIPVTLAAADQAGAILLFSASVIVSHQLRGRAGSKS